MNRLPFRMRRRWIGLAMGLAAAAWVARPVMAQRPNALELLPKSTAAVVWIPDAPEMAERYMSTALGQMLQDPQVEPLVRHLYGSAAEAVANMKERVGLSLPELLAIPQGELAVALVASEEGPPELVALLDVGDQLSNARKLLARVTEALERSGARKTERSFGDTKLAVYEGVGDKKRTLIFFEKGSAVVVGSSAAVLEHVISAWNGKQEASDTLAHDAGFAAVMRGSRHPDQKPHVVWFADPIALMRSIGQDNPGVQVSVAMLPVLGLDGLKALGGSFTFDAGQFDSVAVWHVLLASPRDGVPNMIAFEPGEMEPEPWVPADAASYMTLHWDFQTTFDELVALYDGFRGEGALVQLVGKRAKESIGIDVEKELLPALAGRVSLCSRIQRPIDLRSAATAVGIELNDPEAFGELLQEVVAKHEALLERKSYGGKEYFQITPRRRTDAETGPPQPIPCFGIVGDYLMLANHPGLYEKIVLTRQGGMESLADSPDFQRVLSNIRRQSGGREPAMISFERPQEGLRFYYELVGAENTRQRLRQQAETNPFLKTLNTALDENPLPPFAVIEKYFAPTGAILIDDPSGLHHMGFSLRREGEAEE
jgi:hypothetical protein